MRKCGVTLGWEGEWAKNEHTPPEDGMYKTAYPPAPRELKN
jgi:hypothetical protein